MMNLVRQGIRTGVVTTRYPAELESAPPGYVGQIELIRERMDPARARECAAICPTGAIEAFEEGRIRLDRGRCIYCGLCVEHSPEMFAASQDFETAVTRREDLIVISGASVKPPPGRSAGRSPFRRSLHIRHIDTGDDGATISEAKLLDSPAFDMNRIGFFFTTSPRHADALLVTGVVARAMERPLQETYEAMPEPRLIIAAGAEAISGAPFDASSAVAGGAGSILPIDIFIPGSPPAPLALLYGLLLAVGRPGQKRPEESERTQ